MIEKRNGQKCPTCGYNLIARKDDFLICLRPSCNWQFKAKRQEDINVPLYTELKNDFNG